MRPTLFAAIAFAAIAPLIAETPPGLLTLTEDPLVQSPDRNWKSLGIGTWEIRKLDRVYRQDGVEG